MTLRTLFGRCEAHIQVVNFDGPRLRPSLLEGQMDITTVGRQAKLRPECADLYPTLPARMWTSARCVAELVISDGRAQGGRSDKLDQERILSDADFEFRGGYSRWSAESLVRTRLNELSS